MTVIQVLKAKTALTKYFSLKLPPLVTTEVIKFMVFAEAEETKHNSMKAKLLEKYGKKDENGNYVQSEDKTGYVIKEDSYSDFIYANVALENTEVTYEPTISSEDLIPLEMSVGDSYMVYPILKK